MQGTLNGLEFLDALHFGYSRVDEFCDLADVGERLLNRLKVTVRGTGVVQEILEEERILVQSLHG